MGFGPLRVQTQEIALKKVKTYLPKDIISFMEKEKASFRKFVFAPPIVGPKYIQFCTVANVRLFWFACPVMDNKSGTQNTDQNDPNSGKSGYYLGRAVNLVHRASGCWPEGLILWFSEWNVLGFYNYSSNEVKLFPDLSWAELEENPGLYICSQGEGAEGRGSVSNINNFCKPWEYWEYHEEA